MTAALVLQMIGGAGFLAGIVAILHFFNTRKSTRSKGSAEAYQAYRTFVAGAFEDAAGVTSRVTADRDKLAGIRATLIDLAQDLIAFARRKGATPDELEPYQDRLDTARDR
ncbi:membrane protein [Mycobacterium phage Zenteno07]|nr:membrane protein [Mycobacterium phage Zenteno07]